MNKKRIERNKRYYVVGPRSAHEEIMAGLIRETESGLKSDENLNESTEDPEILNKNNEPKSSTSEVGSIF